MKLRAALISTLLLAAGPSEAATYIVTYKGTVVSGTDQTGIFGTVGGNLAGLAFTAVYIVNSSLPGAYTYSSPNRSGTYGGTGLGGPSPVSGSMTIGGVTYHSTGGNAGVAAQDDAFPAIGGPRDLVQHQSSERYFTGNVQTYDSMQNAIFSYSNDFIHSPNYTDPLSYVSNSQDQSDGSFTFFKYDHDLGQYLALTNAYLSNESVSIAESSAVPESTAWATMLLGFGLIGGTMRIRRRKTTPRFSFT